jgi:hypothetical protein
MILTFFCSEKSNKNAAAAKKIAKKFLHFAKRIELAIEYDTSRSSSPPFHQL